MEPPDELSQCSVKPSQVFIAVMSDAGQYQYKAKRFESIRICCCKQQHLWHPPTQLSNQNHNDSANETWVKRARELGMKVKFFGIVAEESLPAINVIPFADRKDPRKLREYIGTPGGICRYCHRRSFSHRIELDKRRRRRTDRRLRSYHKSVVDRKVYRLRGYIVCWSRVVDFWLIGDVRSWQ